MPTATYKVRLSPSGKTIGTPPLLVGTGSTGRIWRRHGSATAHAVTATETPIASLDAIAVNIRPGYLYDVQMNYEVAAAACTAASVFTGYYRLRNAATSAWGAWVSMGTNVHSMDDVLSTTRTTFNDEGMFQDAAFSVSATVTCNAVEFALAGTAPGGTLTVKPAASFARIVEYVP